MRHFAAILVTLAFVLPVAACREEGPMEKAGREFDEAVDRIQHGDEGTLERAGREIDEAVEDTRKDVKKSLE